MDLQHHEETILRWINSCQTSEQLELSVDAISQFIEKRFEDREDALTLKLTSERLHAAVTERRVMIVHEFHNTEKVAQDAFGWHGQSPLKY